MSEDIKTENQESVRAPVSGPWKVARVLTIAPVMALVLLSLLFGLRREAFGSLTVYLLSVVFLTVLPVLGYPLQPLLPGFRDKGRDGQRKLAIIMAVIGYLANVISGLFLRVSALVWLVYLTYLFSGLLIVLFNKALKIKASGHACGVAGPVIIAVYAFGAWGLLGLPLLALVYVASLRMKRHTVGQLLWGTALPLIAFACAALLVWAL